MSIQFYGKKYRLDFPDHDVVLQTLDFGDIAVIKETGTEYTYILTKQSRYWTRASEVVETVTEEAKWVIALDDFENGWGELEYPHCSNCNRGVYRHDAGMWCPFCGKSMKNPMTY